MTTTNKIDIDQYLTKERILIESQLKKLLNDTYPSICNKFIEIARYSTLDGGKRLRAILCTTTYNSVKENDKNDIDALTVASSIEVIHTMSLIHDDLPCMDDDDMRRGKPSCHKQFGEANALLTGDGMLTLPIHWISEKCNNISAENRLRILNEVAKTVTFSLVPGQMKDLEAEKVSCSFEDINEIYRNKTADLIKCAILTGAYSTSKQLNKTTINALENFGINIGIAFQIIDDILDVTTSSEILGKTAGKDLKQNKKTYPSLIGLEESKSKANKLILEAKNTLSNINFPSSKLFSLADFVVNRIN